MYVLDFALIRSYGALEFLFNTFRVFLQILFRSVMFPLNNVHFICPPLCYIMSSQNLCMLKGDLILVYCNPRNLLELFNEEQSLSSHGS